MLKFAHSQFATCHRLHTVALHTLNRTSWWLLLHDVNAEKAVPSPRVAGVCPQHSASGGSERSSCEAEPSFGTSYILGPWTELHLARRWLRQAMLLWIFNKWVSGCYCICTVYILHCVLRLFHYTFCFQ